ncbi:hypothetical protein HDU96_002701 [Phlyctochytrium bullatum]|nr:hypothetical protein HDU96_002701 [Phlyctochytrium bullatum]
MPKTRKTESKPVRHTPSPPTPNLPHLVTQALTTPPGTRGPSAYNVFMKTELPRIKQASPGLSHNEAVRVAAANWKMAPENPRMKKVEAGMVALATRTRAGKVAAGGKAGGKKE